MRTEATQPKVSILMPVRNEERNVVAAIQSVLDQAVALEVLVIDGDSTDRTVDVVAGMGDPRVRILRNRARFIPAALNIGLAAARGEFIARVDAHHRIGAEYLVKGLRHLAAEPAIAAVGGLRVGTANTSTGWAIVAALSSRFGVGNSINHYATTVQDTDHASGGIYRTAVARAVGGWDEALLVNEDVDFDHRILLEGHRITFDPDMKLTWQVRETLPDFARQYRRYGRGKARMVRKNGRGAVRMRHLAAPALVGTLGLAAASALLGRPRSAAALAAPYAAALLAATALTVRDGEHGNEVQPVALTSAFATMHLTWGIGFLEGLLLNREPAAATVRDPKTALDQVALTSGSFPEQKSASSDRRTSLDYVSG